VTRASFSIVNRLIDFTTGVFFRVAPNTSPRQPLDRGRIPTTAGFISCPSTTRKLFILVFLLFSSPAFSASLAINSADPGACCIGFARAHWATSINKEIVFFGNSHNPVGSNSIRVFDPVSNTWEYLWPNDPANGGLQNRDNYASLYVPRLDELWVWGGSGLENYPGGGALRSGRFSISQKRWLATSTTDAGAFSAVVSSFGGFLPDLATAWSDVADMGIMFGGSQEGNPTDRMWIIEPNPAGPQAYKMSEIVGGTKPPPRTQVMNNLVAAGPDFYLYGGAGNDPATGQPINRTDLWKFSSSMRSWSRLPDAPGGGYQSSLTYDSARDALVSWVNDRIYVFDLASQKWSDQTPAGLPCIFNQIGVYAPTAGVHLFEGGNKCSDQSSPGPQVYEISLTGAQVLSFAPAISKTSGQPPIGYFDEIASDGTATGWTLDPDAPDQSNDINIYVDGPAGGKGSLVGTITTNGARPDVNASLKVSGNHGFAFAIPSNLRDGKSHLLYIYGIDKTGDSNFLLNNSPRSFTLSGGTSTPPPSTKFQIGNRVSVTAGTLNVRSTPSTSGTILGSQSSASTGTIIGGPTYSDASWWWQVDYDSGADGWSVEDYLTQAPPSTLTPIATPDLTALTLLAASTSTGTAARDSALLSNGWLNIPTRLWVSRPYPLAGQANNPQKIGETGFGPSPFGAGAKHQRLVWNSTNRRLYFYSGDFGGGQFGFMSSFKTDMYSYDLINSKDGEGDYQNWRLEWPHCGLTGETSPIHTDESPFYWDSKRNIFWITGGWETSTEDAVATCHALGVRGIYYGNSASTEQNPQGNTDHGPDILQFNPTTNRFVRPPGLYKAPFDGAAVAQDGSALIGGAPTPRHSIYNPTTDEIIMFGHHGGWGNYVIRMNAQTGVWTRDGGEIGGNLTNDAIDGSYINDTISTHEQLALDVEHQWIYLIQPHDAQGRFYLLRYDITHHNLTRIGPIPLPMSGPQPNFCNQGPGGGCTTFPFYATPFDSTALVYDSVNKVVLWPASSNEGRPIMMIYHPDSTGGKNGTWEVDSMNRDRPNEIIFGSNGTFIPELNVTVIYGGFGTPNSDFFAANCPTCNAPQNYFWLYRYGNGDGQIPVPSVTPPSLPQPPSTLTAVDLGVTGEDKVGQTNQTTPNGKPDFHILVSGLRSTPNKVTITSDTAGIWETPFNGANWILASQYDGKGNGDFWFEPFASNKFHVKIRYADGTTDEVDALNQVSPAPNPAPPSTLKAVDLGITGEDKVGPINPTTPNGKPDFHISVSGLRGTPNKITITSDTGGIWETPFNGANWILAIQYDGKGNGDLWFEPFASNKFHVKVRYADGTTDEADASKQVLNPPAPPALTPLVRLSSTNIAFASQIIGNPAMSQQVTLSNSGTAPLTIIAITTAGDFSQSSTCAATLAPGSQCMITASFQPLVTGTRTGALSIIDNAAGTPHVINLTGTGAAPLATDTTPPNVAILSPTAGTVSRTVAGKVTANDNVGINKIELYKDSTIIGSSATNPYNFDWDTTKDSNGTHTLIAMAYDTSNNRSSAVVSVNVQNVAIPPPLPPPTVVIQSPISGTTIDASSVKLVAQVTSGASIVGVQFKVDGINLGPELTLAPYTLVWDTTNISNGAHVLTAVVRDTSGNSSVSPGVTVQVNRPSVPVIRRPSLGRRF
jgi:hypothetical protein